MKPVYFVLAALVVLLILIVVFRNKITALFSKKDTVTPPVPSGTGSGSAATPATTGLDYDLLLKIGMSGPEVKELQRVIGVTQDGAFGPQTEAAVVQLFISKTGSSKKEITLNQAYLLTGQSENSSGTFFDTYYNLIHVLGF